jgi:triphosphoribosyl-dephospho-CoA synthase
LSADSSKAVTEKAKQFVFKMSENSQLKTYQADLVAWDTELKQKALNPGTSADLIAATLLLFRFEQQLSEHRISVP